jgi:hypothetical protein
MELTLLTPAHIDTEVRGRRIVEQIDSEHCKPTTDKYGAFVLPGFEAVKNWDGMVLVGRYIHDQIFGVPARANPTSPNLTLHFLGDDVNKTFIKTQLQKFCFDLEVNSEHGVELFGVPNGWTVHFTPKTSRRLIELKIDASIVFKNHAQALYSKSWTSDHYAWNGQEFFSTTLASNADANQSVETVYQANHGAVPTADPKWKKTVDIARWPKFTSPPTVTAPDYICDIDLGGMLTWEQAKQKHYIDHLRKATTEELEALKRDGLLDLFSELYVSHPERALMLAEARLKKWNEGQIVIEYD